MAETKKCKYWNCNKTAQIEETFCREHYEAFEEFLISKCPVCGQYKDSRYETCIDCYGKKYPAS